MRVLCIDADGYGLDWCLRCKADGHEVRWFMAPSTYTEYVGRGLVKIVPDWRDHMLWADLVFLTDNTKYLTELDAWRDRGIPIMGPNKAGAMLELDREEGLRVMKRAGIAVPLSREFDSYDAAIKYVKSEMRRFVSKPCGVEGDKSLTYVSKSPADMIFMLERWKETGKLKSSFVLQEFIKGVEFAVGGWMGPNGFMPGWEENFEHKPLMNDDKGPGTGEMGTVVRYVANSKLANEVLAPLEKHFLDIGYVGCTDVNCIIDEDGNPWPLEFTNRPGWPAFHIQQALTKGDHAEWMLELLEGGDPKPFVMDEIAIGVVVSLPDFPFDKQPIKEAVGFPLYGSDDEIMDHVHPQQMMAATVPLEVEGKIVYGPSLASAGTYVFVATGTGKTVREAKSAAYNVLDTVTMPGSPIYRTDIGDKLEKCLPTIQKFGYAKGINY